MSTVTPDTSGVRLRLLRRRGEVCDGVLGIPSSGLGLSAAMALGDNARVAVGAAERCRIEPRAGRWVLVNGSSTIVCAVNGRRVAAGAEHPLALGDAIDMGLLRFGFEAVGRDEPASDGQARLRDASSTEGCRLRDLVPVSLPNPVSRGPEADPFDVLDLRAEPWHGPRSGRHRRGDASDCDKDPAAGVLEVLNDEFARVVRDPTQLAGPAQWPEPVAPDRVDAPTLAQLSAKGRAYPLVRDILEPCEDVGALIDRLDPSGDDGWFRVVPDDDVLRLFAPEMKADAARGLPRLTRREHHAVSLDSHLHLGDAHPAPASASGERETGKTTEK